MHNNFCLINWEWYAETAVCFAVFSRSSPFFNFGEAMRNSTAQRQSLHSAFLKTAFLSLPLIHSDAGQSNWTIWSPQNLFLKSEFPLYQQAAFPLSCMQRKGDPAVDPESERQQGGYDHGAFKLDQLESMKLIFEKKISIFLTGHMQHFPFPACREGEAHNGPQK